MAPDDGMMSVGQEEKLPRTFEELIVTIVTLFPSYPFMRRLPRPEYSLGRTRDPGFLHWGRLGAVGVIHGEKSLNLLFFHCSICSDLELYHRL